MCKVLVPSLCGLSGSAHSARGLLLRRDAVEPRGALALLFSTWVHLLATFLLS